MILIKADSMHLLFERHGEPITDQSFLSVIEWEQNGYLRPMETPPGTALNSALLENVFVTLVCILNKIPIFIIGKPGTINSPSFACIWLLDQAAASRSQCNWSIATYAVPILQMIFSKINRRWDHFQLYCLFWPLT